MHSKVTHHSLVNPDVCNRKHPKKNAMRLQYISLMACVFLANLSTGSNITAGKKRATRSLALPRISRSYGIVWNSSAAYRQWPF